MINYQSTLATSDAYKERSDCAVKALAIACNQPYLKVHAIISVQGRINRSGTYQHQYMAALGALNHTATVVPKTTGKTISSLHKQLDPNKKYLIEVSGHLLAYAKGSIEDWTGLADRKPSRKRVERILEVTPNLSKNAIRKAARYSK